MISLRQTPIIQALGSFAPRNRPGKTERKREYRIARHAAEGLYRCRLPLAQSMLRNKTRFDTLQEVVAASCAEHGFSMHTLYGFDGWVRELTHKAGGEQFFYDRLGEACNTINEHRGRWLRSLWGTVLVCLASLTLVGVLNVMVGGGVWLWVPSGVVVVVSAHMLWRTEMLWWGLKRATRELCGPNNPDVDGFVRVEDLLLGDYVPSWNR